MLGCRGLILAAAALFAPTDGSWAAERAPLVTVEAGVRVVRLMAPTEADGVDDVRGPSVNGHGAPSADPLARGPRIISLRDRGGVSPSASDEPAVRFDQTTPVRRQEPPGIIKDPYAPSRARSR